MNPGFKLAKAISFTSAGGGLCQGCVNFEDPNGKDGPAGTCVSVCARNKIDGTDVIAVRDPDYTPVTSTGTDTATAAAIAIKPKKPSIKATILALLEQYPAGLTGEEIAQRGNLRLNSVTPRFAELNGRSTFKGVITECGRIKDSGTRRSGQIVWVLNK